MRRHQGSSRPLGLLAFVSLMSAGCEQFGDTYRSDAAVWVWFLTPFLALALFGAIAVLWSRKAQLDRWDLKQNPDEPSVRRIEVVMWAIAGGAWVLFLLNGFLVAEVAPGQLMFNAALWLLGATLGVGVSLLAGLLIADRLYGGRG